MSTSTRRPLAHAVADARALRALFPVTCYSRWHMAGSARRGRAQVGDVEHVVLATSGDIEISGGLFAETRRVNLLLHRLDELVRTYQIAKHLYGGEKPGSTAATRWGDKLRGVDYRDHLHEFWLADEHNFGAVYAIRTGPAGYSRMLVSELRRQGYLQNDGYVWDRRTLRCGCGWDAGWVHAEFAKPKPGDPRPAFKLNSAGEAILCPRCTHGDRIHMDRVSVPDEQTYFRLCGVDFAEPSNRIDPEDQR
jgi:hypothetical protein